MKAPNALLELRASVALDDYVADIAWSNDARRLAIAGGEGKMFLVEFDAERLRPREIGEHGLGALAVAWQPGGDAFVSSGQDSALVAWDGSSGAVLQRRRPATAWTQHLAFTPDGKTLATAAGRQIFLWSPTLEPLRTLEPLSNTIAALAFDRAGRDLAAALQGGLVLHRFEPQLQQRSFDWPAACLTTAFSPNGRVIVTGTQDGSVHFWYLASGKDSQMRGYPAKVADTVWTHDSRYLATIAGEALVVWDFGGKGPEGSRPIQLNGHTERIECLAAQPGGNHLVTGGRDWRLSLWSPGKYPQALDAHLTDSEPSRIVWSPDGRHVAVGERKGKLAVYELVRLP
ncbi:MAG: WD40 repeat domain-containing protein [Steroidobacteraceae bacterium]|jgi:WD40 repeat protein